MTIAKLQQQNEAQRDEVAASQRRNGTLDQQLRDTQVGPPLCSSLTLLWPRSCGYRSPAAVATFFKGVVFLDFGPQ
jgi:hypothetical protein